MSPVQPSPAGVERAIEALHAEIREMNEERERLRVAIADKALEMACLRTALALGKLA